MQTLDCNGLACPNPVIKTKELIENTGASEVRVLVDNEAASQNVARFLQSRGYETNAERANSEYRVMGRRAEVASPCAVNAEANPETRKMQCLVMAATDRLGYGDDGLGKKLMLNFLLTLKEMDGLWRLVFVNNGVKLTVEESDALPAIQDLERSGVSVLVCGTCLTHFDLLHRKRVGETTNMLDIVTSLQVADKVINL